MKKILIVSLLASSCSFVGREAFSQTLEQAVSSFRQFCALQEGGVKGDQLYKSLDECYRINVAVASKSRPNSEEEMTTRAQLKAIRPTLLNAAAYYQDRSFGNSLLFARAFVDIVSMDIFEPTDFPRDAQFSQLAYYAASGSYNSADYRSAVKYFKEYLAAGSKDRRRDVYLFMAQACEKINDFSLAQRTLDKAVLEYPGDYEILAKAINNCIDNGDNVKLQSYLTTALSMKPGDRSLLGIQGQSYEKTGDYAKAIASYTKLNQVQPNNLNVHKHLAVNYYNMGVLNYNNSLQASSPSTASRYKTQAKDFFKESIPVIQTVLDNDQSSVEFWQAMAVACNYSGNETGYNSANNRLASLGQGRVTKDVVPELISLDGRKPASAIAAAAKSAHSAESEEIPTFSKFAKDFIGAAIEKWQAKDPYETVKEYQQRVNVAARDKKVKDLTEEAKFSYLQTYKSSLTSSDFQLKPYDAENEVFLASSRFGEVIIPVPRSENEARTFEKNWTGVQISDSEYCIDGDKLVLKSATFRTPGGKSYKYNNASAMNYTVTEVDMQLGEIDYSALAKSGQASLNKVKKNTVSVGTSDIDVNIPENHFNNAKTFAFIIANEKYQKVSEVNMASNDGRTMAEYCRKTLACPKENVRLYENATFGNMLGAVRDMKAISDAFQGDINFIFYYAGHGIPDDATKDAFLLPVDADGTSTEVCYPLSRLYRELGDLNAKCVAVFLDACFSGNSRKGESLTVARGVAVKAKTTSAQGNMVVFSAASGDETAYPYEEKGHGLFTYFLLKKLQETAGDVSLSELGDYVSEKVRQQSVVVNHKAQTPVVTPSVSMEDTWKRYRLVK